MTTAVMLALAVSGAAVAGCDSGPSAGDIMFNLTTPNQDDGAVQFTIRSVAPATLASVSAECTGCQVFTQAVGETEIRGVLLGAVVPGAAIRVTVSDREAEGYTASVEAVSDRQYALRSVIGYGLAPSP